MLALSIVNPWLVFLTILQTGSPTYLAFSSPGIIQQAAQLTVCESICSFCSRMKRGRLYACARREGYNVLAMGQHLDDLAERCVVNMKIITFLSLVLEATNYSTMLIIIFFFLSFSDCSCISDKQKKRLKRNTYLGLWISLQVQLALGHVVFVSTTWRGGGWGSFSRFVFNYENHTS